MPIITVSRQYGSGGSAVAARIASELGWTLYDNCVVDAVAARLGLTHEEVEAREERVPSFVERVTSAMALGVPEVMPMVGDLLSQPTEERLVDVTAMVIEEAVQAGPSVLVGRGAQCMLAARDDALHVYCFSPFPDLVRYAVEKLGVRPHEAANRVNEVNKHREEYVARHFKRKWRDPANYDICVNTARLGINGAADLVVKLARERLG